MENSWYLLLKYMSIHFNVSFWEELQFFIFIQVNIYMFVKENDLNTVV